LQRAVRANVPDAWGEIRPEQERKVDKGTGVEVECGAYFGAWDEQEGFVPARDVAKEWRSVDEYVLER
jgi:hypothetical protein